MLLHDWLMADDRKLKREIHHKVREIERKIADIERAN